MSSAGLVVSEKVANNLNKQKETEKQRIAMQPYLPVCQFLELDDLNETSHYDPWNTKEGETIVIIIILLILLIEYF